MDDKRNNAAKLPGFLTVFIPEIHSERILIPDGFVKIARQHGWEPRDFTLKNSSGRVWEVRTLTIDDQLFFDDGWKQFRKDNWLEAKDYVIFTHEGNNVFSITIIEQSTSCEKIMVNDLMELDEDDDEYDPGEDDSDDEEEEEEMRLRLNMKESLRSLFQSKHADQ